MFAAFFTLGGADLPACACPSGALSRSRGPAPQRTVRVWELSDIELKLAPLDYREQNFYIVLVCNLGAAIFWTPTIGRALFRLSSLKRPRERRFGSRRAVAVDPVLTLRLDQ